MSPQTIIEATKEKALETKDKVLARARQRTEETIEKVEKLTLFKRLFQVNRNVTLAGLGAVALVSDHFSSVGEKCLERGEEYEQQARDYANDGLSKIKKLVAARKAEREEIKADAETATEEKVEEKAEEKAEEKDQTSTERSEDVSSV
jgi:hypothetical protein